MATPSLVHLLQERADELPGHRSYTFLAGGEESESLTFARLNRRARAIAARLQRLGAKGERALLLYPAGTEYIAAFYGCLAAGTVAVPGYPPRMNRNLNRLESIIKDAEARFALTTDAVYRQLSERFDESPSLKRLQWVVTDPIAEDEADGWTDPNATRETLAFLQYTSASTSAPKGVMVTHGNILHNQVLMKEAVQHDRNTIAVSWLPLFHDMGLISIVLSSLYNGIPCYLVAPVDFLKKPRLWLEAISKYGATFSGAPDFGYQLCVERISAEERAKLDLSKWRVAFNGSEPIRSDTLRLFTETFAECGFRPTSMFPCYGLAENTLFASGRFHDGPTSFSRASLERHRPAPATEGHLAQLVSCGKALLDSRIVIADPKTRRRCGEGEVGEIWLASPSVAQGYWNQPRLSEETFRAQTLDGDGPFLRTADLGFFHAGELFITGRIKDLIIIRGRNLCPQDIEQTVEACDAAIQPTFVAAVAVDAGTSERLVIVAEIRREARRELDTEEIVRKIRNAVAAEFAVEVSAVVLLRPGQLPKTSSGKTQRAHVKQQFLDGQLKTAMIAEWRDENAFRANDPEPPRAPKHAPTQERIESWLVQRIAAQTKIPATRIDRTASLLVYGLDSVVLVAIFGELEDAFRVTLDLDRIFHGEPSLREVAQRVHAATRATAATADVPAPAPVAAPARPQPVPTEAPPAQPASVLPIAKPKKLTLGNTDATAASPTPKPVLAAVPDTRHEERAPKPKHPFRTHVNPELGRVLEQMAMDKSFVRGEGSWLWDEAGRRYLDFLAQYGALPFGFNPPRIWSALNAVRATAEPSFVQPSYLNAAGELAKRLLAVAPPGMAYVTYANSGAEAIEAAIKLCRSTTKRHDILAAGNGFHGKTLGALSATDKEKYQKGFGAPVPGFHYVPYGDADALRRALAGGRYAAFLVEPIQGEGGIVEPPAGYLRLARKLCREAGTLFVADEIQTGLGRTGAMFVCRELGITPDVMTVAKALGGGLVPIGACLATAAAYNEDFALKHTSTFAGNTLACRAGIATLDLLEADSGALVAQVKANGARLKDALLALADRYPGLIAEVRGRGYFLGLRLGLDRHSVDDGLLGYLGEQEALTAIVVSHLLHVEGVRVGFTLNHGGVLRIEPPLTATWEECQFFLAALERVLVRIDRRNLAALTSQVTGFRPAVAAEVVRPRVTELPRKARLDVRAGDGRFAFLVHPLAWKDYGDIDESLAPLSGEQLAKLSGALADNFDPMVVGETRITAENGKTAYGEFILVPRRAEELRALPPEQAVSEIREAVRVAQKRGAKIVGLGAYTSVVTQGGLSLVGEGLPAITTGNSYTVIAARQTIRLASADRGWQLPRRTVAVLGAGGSIGQALSVLLARDTGRLLLIGNPAHPDESRERLLQVAGRIVCSLDQLKGFAPGSVASWVAELAIEAPQKPDRATLIRLGEEFIARTGAVELGVDAAQFLPRADVVVCCTSTTERMVTEETLRREAIVCDVSRPSNVGAHVRARRPDVLVLDGGVVRLPGSSQLGFNAGIGKTNAYACMAETMMLALEQRYRDASLGFDLSLDNVLEMERLAEATGFRVVSRKQAPEALTVMRLLSREENEAQVLEGAPPLSATS
ncbi:MAG: aminotransferase class III-fold pyridoxal phosphate-dependent enzyme [Acidobacteria bacterium]|nr:aminotransferase class III-fold pyridoxal phosphate-dependent enzyme [Acidobacteriota bacterium]MBV9477691.1 aminotransferase class III-fold pyridoxal phosphate-dependent enzyme [Acidobacteriota bacterium]